ncbi:hypothetical protein [Xenorhabdus szentirmaii]|uniref:Phage protein n=2 Tax=Xenorhabdus szentirmaii TaxID=290112 RepID=W1ITS7_9GAMM|nr:hypothetical protein [Xenorhabdus szentirmaii]PHM30545.1 hypothetical protein Xsze_04135 [Xenorhabdus szentirmaii DSM 16338]CDL81006.1 conserved hypothetical protein [Xenorhabdus szentirmaii DSM 16338]
MEKINRSNLVFDMYYSSSKNGAAGEKVAEITAIVRDRATGEEVTTTTFKRITGKDRSQKFDLGVIRLSRGNDQFCTSVIEHYRKDVESQFKNLMVEVSDVLESGLNSSTWIGMFGLRVLGDMDAALHLPENVLALLGEKPIEEPTVDVGK